jgi:hypothetical protein
MRDVSPTADASHCPSCGTVFAGAWCAACGERRLRPELLGLRHFAAEAWASLTDTDGRLWRSLWNLLRRPGELTRAWWIGRRRPFLGPIQVFLVASVTFFLLSPFDLFSTPLRFHLHIDFLAHRDVARDLVQRRIAPELDRDTFLREVARAPHRDGAASVTAPAPQYAEAVARYVDFERDFDQRTSTLARSLVFVMIPLFALASWLLAQVLRGPRSAILHLVHATHLQAAVQVYSILLGVLLPPPFVVWLLRAAGNTAMARLDLIYSLIFFAALALYLFFAARRLFAFGRARALAYAALLVTALLWIWTLYRALLFFVVYYGID